MILTVWPFESVAFSKRSSIIFMLSTTWPVGPNSMTAKSYLFASTLI